MFETNELIATLESFQDKAVTVSQDSSLTFFKIFNDFMFFDESNTLVFIDLKTEEKMTININAIKSISINDIGVVTLNLEKDLIVKIRKEEDGDE